MLGWQDDATMTNGWFAVLVLPQSRKPYGIVAMDDMK